MIRGLVANASGLACWTVSGNILYSVGSDGARTVRGTLLTSRGHVGMQVGLNQLVIVDGTYGYVLDLLTNAFERITAAGWLGSKVVGYLDGYFVFNVPGTQTIYISEIDNALAIDPLQTHIVGGSPDLIVSIVTQHREVWLFGATTVEVWQNTGGDALSDFALTRNDGAFMQYGCMAAFSAKKLDNSVFWLGQDEQGGCQVFKAVSYSAQRISTRAVEQTIQKALDEGNDIANSVAYGYQHRGHAFYVLQVPGVQTTWAYDVSTGEWAERAEYHNSELSQHRGDYHCYAYGKHIIGGKDADILYTYDIDANTNAGDVLLRGRISPHYETPQQSRIPFALFELDCVVGKGKPDGTAPQIMLRYSNDGMPPVGNWRYESLGALGQTNARVRFNRCGSAEDRVWEVRVTDDTPFAIVSEHIEAG